MEDVETSYKSSRCVPSIRTVQTATNAYEEDVYQLVGLTNVELTLYVVLLTIKLFVHVPTVTLEIHIGNAQTVRIQWSLGIRPN